MKEIYSKSGLLRKFLFLRIFSNPQLIFQEFESLLKHKEPQTHQKLCEESLVIQVPQQNNLKDYRQQGHTDYSLQQSGIPYTRLKEE